MATKEEQAEMKKKLTAFGKTIATQAAAAENPTMDVPIRALSNIKYDKGTGLITMGEKTAKRFFFNIAHVKKFVQTVAVARVSKGLSEENKSMSLRQVFYALRRTLPGTNIDIVDEQTESDAAVEDLELMTDALREQLRINANKSGSVAGKVVIEDRGDTIDWSKLGSGGWSVPSNVESIKFKKIEAKFVVYMEKAAMWERLNEDKFWEKHNCIIISSQGQATRGIRRLLQRLSTDHNLPIYVLTDFDPWGFYIYSVLKFGSISLAHISERLAIPKAKFLGLSADDVERYGLGRHKIKFKDVDHTRLKQIEKYAWFKDNKEWQRQFEMMKKMSAKVELDAIVSKGISFISEKYLPDKIKEKDWLE
ncbi:MAG: DNA topoisomerase IV subunit A [Candidatus Aenigmatarchaeota archaeon]|nr:MAG: DNA topoisomerase IV subunit A [Candidatus Aenigmarchaeota archaeon]